MLAAQNSLTTASVSASADQSCVNGMTRAAAVVRGDATEKAPVPERPGGRLAQERAVNQILREEVGIHFLPLRKVSQVEI